jgi:membrane protein DedA with SNARE-associated domain
MGDWILRTMASGGYPALALLMALENQFPPIPTEVIVPLAGFLVAKGEMTFLLVVAAGTLGSVLGTLPAFYLGRRLGGPRLERMAERHGRWMTVTPKDLKEARAWFRRHGHRAVLIGRLVPGIRSLISIPAGLSHMPAREFQFLAFSALGAALWTAILAGAGFALKAAFTDVEKYLNPVGAVVLGSLLLTYVVRVARWRPQQ